jgi:hypothetical protein
MNPQLDLAQRALGFDDRSNSSLRLTGQWLAHDSPAYPGSDITVANPTNVQTLIYALDTEGDCLPRLRAVRAPAASPRPRAYCFGLTFGDT